MSSLYTSEELFQDWEMRSEFVQHLEIPDDVKVSPAIWYFGDDSRIDLDNYSIPSSGSPALSRAMTDSEIDYEAYHRMKNRRYSDPWQELHATQETFPHGYLSSLKNYINTKTSSESLTDIERHRSTPESIQKITEKMQRFFEDECQVFEADDPELEDLNDVMRGFQLGIEAETQEQK